MSRWWKELGVVAAAGALCGTLVPRVLLPPTAQARGLRRPPAVAAATATPPPSPSTEAAPAAPPSEPSTELIPAPSTEPLPEEPGAPRARARSASRVPDGMERARGRWILDLRGVQSPRALLSGMDLAPPGSPGAPTDGFVVRRTDRAGYARAAGIRPGDVLIAANGRALRSPDDALDAFIAARHARSVSLQFRRGDGRYTVQVELLRGEADLGG